MNTAPSAIPILLVAMFVLCGLVRLAEQEYRDRAFAELLHKYFGLRPLKKLFIALFLVVFCQRGGSKPTNSVPENGSGGTVTNSVVVENPVIGGINSGVVTGDGINAGMGGANTMTGEQFYPPRLTTNQYRAGFALVQATTNAAPWLAVPSNAVVHAPWTRYGVAEDTFWLPTNGWSFVLGSNAVDGVHVSSSGTLSFGVPKGSPLAVEMPDGTNISFLAALQGSLGTVPPQGRFWHAPTPSNSLLCTWQNVYSGRDTNSPVTVQAELFWNGAFAYRYAFANAVALTNFVIGAQNRGGGETWALDATNVLVNGLELRWRAFGMLDPGIDDHDGDGLSTYDEVMLYGTNPALKDSDRDGLEDAAELAAGTNPLNPDTDGDGLADGIDPQPTVWNDTGAVIPNSGGLTYGRVILNGLDPATNWALDSDNDGWPDWKELMAGTSPTDPYSTPQNGDGSCKLFDATFTLGADLPCPVVLNVGGYTLILQKAGSWTLTLKEGEAYNLTLTASQPCAVRLSCSLTSAFAALQDASGAFLGGAQLAGGVPATCGVIAQPTVSVMPEPPERICFHSDAPKTVAAKVSPAMAGSYQWYWYGGGISSASGKSANISWNGGDSYVYLSFTASGATQPRYASREVTKCSKVDEDTWCDDHSCEHWYCACDEAGAEDDDDCGFHGQKVSKCRAAICPTHDCPYDDCPDGWCHQHDTWYSDCGEWWCHMHECYLSECNHDWYAPDIDPGEGGGGSTEEEPDPDPGEPVFGSCDESLATVNNDDDDASGVEDSGESPVGGENDLVAVWPLGYFDGQCCPCPEHHVPPDGSQSAELESCSTRLALWADAAKTNAFGDTVNAGQAVWVEGQNASTAVGADRIVWKWTDEDNHVHRVTNAFTVLSVRLFGDVNLDGQVDAADKALHPLLSHEYGWGMPAATNVFRPVRLRTDVGLSGGMYTLRLAGDAGSFRVWPDASGTNAAPLLVCGQTVTNGVNGVYFLSGGDSDLYVEAVNGGTAILTYQYVGTGDAAGISCAAAMKMTGYKPSVSIANPDSAGWSDLLEKKVILSDKDVRIKISITPALPDLATALSLFGTALKVMTSETCPSGQEFTLTEQNVTLVQMNGSTEMRVALDRPQLVSLGVLPAESQDGIYEKAWMDYGVDDPTMPSNLSDGMAFDNNLTAASRGRCTYVGNLNSSTTNSPIDKSFFIAGGREIITAEFYGEASPRRQVMNQADIFYFSGHGDHGSGTLEGFSAADVGAYWQQDLEISIFSACSVLDINDYNFNFVLAGQHSVSPGKQWEQTGVQYLLGYNATGPNDLQGTATIIADFLANKDTLGVVSAWRQANENAHTWNACVIEVNVAYYYFNNLVPLVHTWESVPKGSW